MNIKMILFDFVTLKMFKIDSPIFLQKINMLVLQLFLLFKKSTTFWDNPHMSIHSLSLKLLQKSQFVNFTFSQSDF